MYALRLSDGLIWTERRWLLFFLNSHREEYWERDNSVRHSKLWIEHGGREYNQFEATLFRPEGKIQHMRGSFRE